MDGIENNDYEMGEMTKKQWHNKSAVVFHYG